MRAPHAAIVLLALTVPVAAQEEPAGATSIVRVEPTISVDFAGGSLADYVAAIRNASAAANILLPAEASEVVLPAMNLRDVAVDAALDAVSDMVEEPWSVSVRGHGGKQGERLYTVRVKQQRRGNNPAMMPETMVAVYSLRGLTENLPGAPAVAGLMISAETILTAIETGLAISDERQKAMIRYHPDSGLLFVRGSGEQTNIVQQVLRSMENDLERRRNAAEVARANERVQKAPTGQSRDGGVR